MKSEPVKPDKTLKMTISLNETELYRIVNEFHSHGNAAADYPTMDKLIALIIDTAHTNESIER